MRVDVDERVHGKKGIGSSLSRRCEMIRQRRFLFFFLSFFPRFVSLKSRRDRPAVDPDFAISASTEKRAFVLRRVAPRNCYRRVIQGAPQVRPAAARPSGRRRSDFSRSSASHDTFTFPLATMRGRFVSLLSLAKRDSSTGRAMPTGRDHERSNRSVGRSAHPPNDSRGTPAKAQRPFHGKK